LGKTTGNVRSGSGDFWLRIIGSTDVAGFLDPYARAREGLLWGGRTNLASANGGVRRDKTVILGTNNATRMKLQEANTVRAIFLCGPYIEGLAIKARTLAASREERDDRKSTGPVGFS